MINTIRKALVVLTMRVTSAPDYDERRDSISHDWIELIELWGMMPLLIPNSISDPAAYIRLLKPDAIILTGGDDLCPGSKRDSLEASLLNYALHNNLPVLGVCRGMQLINVLLGGKITPLEDHVDTYHKVTVKEPWAGIFGQSIEVNSYHTSGVAEMSLAPDLVEMAVDADGFIEAFCHKSKPLAAVMWHPERGESMQSHRQLFSRLIELGAFWK